MAVLAAYGIKEIPHNARGPLADGFQPLMNHSIMRYFLKKGDPAYGSESACVAFLMKKYQELAEKQE